MPTRVIGGDCGTRWPVCWAAVAAGARPVAGIAEWDADTPAGPSRARDAP
jgi:hypothetical protein